MKKRIFAALSAMLMLLALAGCGAKQVDYDATCTISISCATILDNMDACDPNKREQVPQDGVILAPVEVGFQTGENVFDVLQRVCRENRIQMESKWTPLYESAYIQGIHNRLVSQLRLLPLHGAAGGCDLLGLYLRSGTGCRRRGRRGRVRRSGEGRR